MQGEGIFKIEDINSIIKLFAFSIQERFDEIDGITNNVGGDGNMRYYIKDTADDQEYLVRKYRNYMAYDEKEIKYLQKLTVRIMQIIQFFKQRSKNEHLLDYISKKINDKLNKIVSTIPVDVQWLYSYIIDLAKNGFSLKKSNGRERRYSLKKMQTSEKKILESNQDLKNENVPEQPKQIRKAPATADPTKRRRPVSMSAKHGAKMPIKQSPQAQIAKLYSIMEVDIGYLQKIIENKDKIKVQKDCMRSNASISCAIQIYDKLYVSSNLKKKQKIDATLQEVNNRTAGRPVTNNWISRKKKMAEYRKKRTDYENFSFA